MSLIQRAEKWTQQWKAEGKAEGMAEGEARGQRLGMAKTLKNLAQRRFGDLPVLGDRTYRPRRRGHPRALELPGLGRHRARRRLPRR